MPPVSSLLAVASATHGVEIDDPASLLAAAKPRLNWHRPRKIQEPAIFWRALDVIFRQNQTTEVFFSLLEDELRTQLEIPVEG
jgi:hypothetical protein